MVRITRRARRRLILQAVLAAVVLSVVYLVLPLDSPIRLALTFNAARVTNAVREATYDKDAWLRTPAPYNVELNSDVGYLIKTGYGTRHRVPLLLDAFKANGNILGKEGESFLIVGDWTSVNDADAQKLGAPIHDALKLFWDAEVNKRYQDHHRLRKYHSLQQAIDNGDEQLALNLGKQVGWELDALKFMSGMELMFKKMPLKKWYIILDDDTYLVKSTLELLLRHLNSEIPHYIGNAVGDFRGRFGHGGSAILLSHKTMARLFAQPNVVAQSYHNSLDEKWGDRMVATTLQKLGIYLEERYSHHFNGEAPNLVRVAADRFCSPIASFHSLRTRNAMADVSRAIGNAQKPVQWGQLLDIFGHGATDTSSRKGADYVGTPDERTKTRNNVKDAGGCRRVCEENKRWCLAWTYDSKAKDCHMSPWVVPGAAATDSKESGVNRAMLKQLQERCIDW